MARKPRLNINAVKKSVLSKMKLFSFFLMFFGLSWIACILATSFQNLHYFTPQNYTYFFISTSLVSVSFMGSWLIFHIFLANYSSAKANVEKTIKLHTAGQLLRYLPGRFWGIIYQISYARDTIPASVIARSNVSLMIFLILGNAFFICFFLAFLSDKNKSLLICLGSFILLAQSFIFLGGVSCVIEKIANSLPLTEKTKVKIIEILSQKISWTNFLFAQSVLIGMWILYIFGINLLSDVFPGASEISFPGLAVFYSLASLLGIISLIAPAGVGVREAAFVFIGSMHSFSQETLAFFAIFFRLWFILIDVFLFLIFYAFFSIKRKLA